MLFNNAPINASVSASVPTASSLIARNGRRLFLHGTDLFWVLGDVGGAQIAGVIRSTDNGATWAAQDTGFSLPAGAVLAADVLANSLCFVIIDNTSDPTLFYVARFDLSSSTYTSVSLALSIATSGTNPMIGTMGGAIASSGDFHLAVSFQNDSNPTLGPLVYYTETAGAWAGGNTVIDPDYSFPFLNNGLGFRDTAGDIHWIYETSHSRVASPPPDNDYPYQLRHVKEGGSPSVIQSVSAPSTTSFNTFNAVVFGGQIYLANTRETNFPSLWVSDSDTAPTTWTEVTLDTAGDTFALPGYTSFAVDAGGKLNAFYMIAGSATHQHIRIVTLASGVWGAPGFAYDPILNPVASSDFTEFTFAGPPLEVVLVNGDLALGSVYPASGNNNAVFLTGTGSTDFPTPPPSGRVLNFVF